MAKRSWLSVWNQGVRRNLAALKRVARKTRIAAPAKRPAAPRATTTKTAKTTARPPAPASRPAPGGLWLAGLVMGAAGARRYRLYRPPGVGRLEKLPLLVMLHGCGQDPDGFAASTRMNSLAARHRFMVLYPEQDRLANPQGCWNWFNTRSGRAQDEAALIAKAIAQACRLHRADAGRVALAGLSAGASMAALMVTLDPARYRALVMHAGVPPGCAQSAVTALAAMRGQRTPTPLAATAAEMRTVWPPLLVIQGSADAVVARSNGAAAAALWAAAAGARAQPPRRVQRGGRRAVVLTDFKAGSRLVATLAEVDGLAHAWSGGAASQAYSDPRGPDASRMTWAFAARQFGA